MLTAALSALTLCEGSAAAADEVQELIRRRLETVDLPAQIVAGGEGIYAARVLPAFYEARLFAPAWSRQGALTSAARSLLEALREATREGLRPEDYHLSRIRALLGRLEGSDRAAVDALLTDLDLLLTDAFLIYGSHLVGGRVSPETFDPQWIATRREVDLGRVLATALESDTIRQALDGLLPDHAGYFRLRAALERYREVTRQGGWPTMPEDTVLRPGDSGEAVTLLRRRLAATGDLPHPLQSASDRLDGELEAAVRRFQGRHGLDPDGVIGPKTLAALNVPAGERLTQIELNLERWRWLPQELGRRYVLVNIPDFSLRVVEDHRTVLEMRVVVGRPYRRTPVFSDTMRYLVLNPSWEVPTSIAAQDLLPQIRKDPGFLGRQGFRVYQGWGSEQEQLDPATVDWSALGPGRFPYRLHQDPGPLNALGRVKFMFPNKFNVYLHDTPAREVFSKMERDFSSGCIRLQHALDLAEYLLQEAPEWSRERIVAAIDTQQERTVPLPTPIPVHLLYWTAWADEDGTVHFRRDLYVRDKALAEALHSPPPVSSAEATP